MTDNVPITAGSGTTIATDDVSGVHYQRVKLVNGTLDDATAIPGGANGLQVQGQVAHDAVDAGNPIIIGGYAKAAAPTNVSADGDAVNAWFLQNGAQAVNLTAAGALIPGDASNGLKVQVATIAAGTTNIGDVDVLTVPADPFGANADAASATGSISAKLRQIAATGIPITNASGASAVNIQDGGNAITVDNGGTFAVQDSQVIADDAAFTPATSKVFPVGFTLDDTSTDVVDEGDIGAARITADRKQLVVLGDSSANDVIGGGSKTDTTDQSIMAASGSASIFNFLCWVAVCNTSATNTYVNVKDGSTVRLVLPLPAYGGAVFNLARPIKGTGNTAWNLAAGGSVTTAYLYGGGYKAQA